MEVSVVKISSLISSEVLEDLPSETCSVGWEVAVAGGEAQERERYIFITLNGFSIYFT